MSQMRQKVIQVISKPPKERKHHEIDMVLPWLRKKSQLLRKLDRGVLMDVVRRCGCLRTEKDDVIIKQGDKGDSFFIILSGTVSVYIDTGKTGEDENTAKPQRPIVKTESRKLLTQKKPQEGDTNVEKLPDEKKKVERSKFGKFVLRFEAGKCFGEIALIGGDSLRNASIISDENTDFLVVHRKLYDSTLKEYQEQEYRDRNTFVNESPLFRRWPERFKRLLEMSLVKEEYTFDSTIIQQGAPANGLTFIYRGKAKVLVEPKKHSKQYPKMYPLTNENDVYSLELGRPSKKKKNEKKTKSLRLDQVMVRRSQGYAAAEQKIFHKSVILCNVENGEVFGDLEAILGLATYINTVVCTTKTEVYTLNLKNYERLVLKKNPQTLDILKRQMETKLRSRSQTLQGSQIPIFKHILYKLNEDVKRQNRRELSPIGMSKELPNREILFQHLVKEYADNKAELCEPLVPGAMYYKEIMRERARIRQNIKPKENGKKLPSLKKHLKVRLPRTTKQLKDDIRRQQESEEDKEKVIILKMLRSLEDEQYRMAYEEAMKRERERAEALRKVQEEMEERKRREEEARIAAEEKDKEDGNDKQDTEDVDRPVFERSKTYLTDRYETLSNPEIREEEKKMKKVKKKKKKRVSSAEPILKGDDGISEEPKSSSPIPSNMPQNSEEGPTKNSLPLIQTAIPNITDSSNFWAENAIPLRRNKAKERLYRSIANRKSIPVTENTTYRDWETSDKSLQKLEDRLKDFAIRMNPHRRVPTANPLKMKLPRLQRFEKGEETFDQPKPGGKVVMKKKLCKVVSGDYKLVEHEHVRHHMVPQIQEFDQIKRDRMVNYMMSDTAEKQPNQLVTLSNT